MSKSGNGGAAAAPREGAAEVKKGGFPAPITILTLGLVAVWVAACFIPSGEYQLDAGGSPIARDHDLDHAISQTTRHAPA